MEVQYAKEIGDLPSLWFCGQIKTERACKDSRL